MTSRPNILLVIFDSLCDRGIDAAPSLTALRNESLSFTNAHAPSPESGPARASLFTGLDMAAHGVWTDGVPLPDHEVTLPERFASTGYHTWLVGRRQLTGMSNWTTEYARPYEYAHFDWAHGPLHRSRQNAYLAWLEETAPDSYAELFPHQANADDTAIPAKQRAAMAALPDALSFNHWAGQQAVARILQTPNNQPFFGIVGLVTGDTMGVPLGSGPCLEATDSRALAQADKTVGTLINAVKEDPNIILVVTAARGAGATEPLHRDALSVPLFLHGAEHPPSRIDGAVSTIDLAPTLYEMTGVVPASRMQGRSLVSEDPRGWALARMRHPEVTPQTALTTAYWKLIFPHGAGSPQLYDLAQDPNEENDLAQSPDHQTDLDALLDWMINARVALEDRTEPRVALF